MAKFVYSMQNILDMKEKLERQEKNDYSRANVRLLEAQDELERLKDRPERAGRKIKTESQGVYAGPADKGSGEWGRSYKNVCKTANAVCQTKRTGTGGSQDQTSVSYEREKDL